MSLDLNYKPEVLVSTENMSEEEWLKYRTKGIGGSDAAVVMRMSPYKTARDLYFEKTGRKPDFVTNDLWVQCEVGHRLEELVAMIFQKKTGFKVWQEKKMFRHPKYRFMIADVDYFAQSPSGEKCILECKTAGYNSNEKWDDGGIPYHYEIQVRHYMAVNNINKGFIACLFGNSENDFVYREIERELDIEENIINEEESFWNNNVLGFNEPEITECADLALESIKRFKFGEDLENVYTFEKNDRDIFKNIFEYRTAKKAAETVVKEYDEKLKSLYVKLYSKMNGLLSGKCEDDDYTYIFSCKTSKRSSINKDNLERMQLNDREIYDKYITVSETNRFNVKMVNK